MADPSRTLITGFLGFGRFAVNPSALLATRSGRPFELIEVTFAAAEAFVDLVVSRDFDRLLLMGVTGSSIALRLERQAWNRVGAAADASGMVNANNTIDASAAELLPGTLWSPALVETLTRDPRIITSDDAGDYLCNYLYFRTLQRVIDRPVGFLHVPPVEAMRLETQASVLADILRGVEDDGLRGSRGV